MATTYELWDTETHNLVAAFDSREAALAAVRRTLDVDGHERAETLLLGSEDAQGENERIAAGRDLIDLALRSGIPGDGTSGASTLGTIGPDAARTRNVTMTTRR